MTATGYGRKRSAERARVIFELPADELASIDRWGVPAGMPSRTAAIRELIRKGLEAASNSQASDETAGLASQA